MGIQLEISKGCRGGCCLVCSVEGLITFKNAIDSLIQTDIQLNYGPQLCCYRPQTNGSHIMRYWLVNEPCHTSFNHAWEPSATGGVEVRSRVFIFVTYVLLVMQGTLHHPMT